MAKSILIAEDDRDTRTLLATSLEAEGYVVLTASNGRELLNLATNTPPDLILLDMMMPVTSGYDALVSLRANPATAAIPVIGISAKVALEDIELATDLGADAYITKPFRIAQVLQMIEAHI